MRKTLYRDLTHMFCPAEPTKNCPRGQPQDNSALHSLARATPTKTLISVILKGSPSGMRLPASLAPSDLQQPKGWFSFHSAPFTLSSVVQKAAFHQLVADHALLIPGPSQEILMGPQQGFQGSNRSRTVSKSVQVPGD
ncbi:hypothetical protein P7K49_016816 [Saguinus oedipus]|uniref:Uncharacterized protein n=1 Tax=Saguinus oedipus TaxID=9490 RepID=A0ABQ9VG28_SAGOE|nr:hypothetical protein P7K49_016816 [Saguinus oedipus]